jgi:UDP-glucose 4-epimerase
MKFLLLGGAGFIGINLTRKLIELGHHVILLDNFSFARGVDSNEPTLSVYTGDATSEASVSSAIERFDPDVVVWLMAFHSYTPGQAPVVQQSWLTHSLSRIIPVVAKLRNRKFILMSSDLVYRSSNKRLKETSALNWDTHKINILDAIVKERYTVSLCDAYKIPYAILRLSNVIGNREFIHPAADTVTFIIDSLLLDQDMIITNAQQKKDYIDIANATDMIINIIKQDDALGIYNISSGVGISNNELLQYLIDLTSPNKLPKVVQSKEAHLVLDNSKALCLGEDIEFALLKDKLAEIVRFRVSILEGS